MHKAGSQLDGSSKSQISCRARGCPHSHEADTANLLLAEYYRCPVNRLVPFLEVGPASKHPGYFRLGRDTICYGRLSFGDPAKGPDGDLEDALEHVKMESLGIQLPFDAGEVVENLRRERYTAHLREEGVVLNELLRKAYYLVRPLLGVPVRRHFQKMHLRGWEDISFPAWPVDATVERIHQTLLALSLKAQGVDRIPFIWL